MTEDEAKTKLCPFGAGAFRKIEGGPERVSILPQHHTSTCIGSACMAWREVHLSVGPQRVHPNVLGGAWIGWIITDDTPDARGYVEISPPGHGVTHGRCGLAGE